MNIDENICEKNCLFCNILNKNIILTTYSKMTTGTSVFYFSPLPEICDLLGWNKLPSDVEEFLCLIFLKVR